MVLLSTSPGARGGASVLEQAVKSASFFDGEVRGSLAVPNFYDHFDMAQDRITDDNLNVKLAEELTKLKS